MKKYNGVEYLFIVNFIFIVVSVLLLINVSKQLISDYQVVQGNLVIDNVYSIVIKEEYVNYLEKNPYVYVDSKRIKIKIIDKLKNYYKNYDRLLIRCRMAKRPNVIDISIYKRKNTFIKLFLKCWEEDK